MGHFLFTVASSCVFIRDGDNLSLDQERLSTVKKKISHMMFYRLYHSQSGNTILDQGITTIWPRNAFNDSILEILITEPPTSFKTLYDESTAAFNAFSIDNITKNYFLFTVENDPLTVIPDISYAFTIPIPSDLLKNARMIMDLRYLHMKNKQDLV